MSIDDYEKKLGTIAEGFDLDEFAHIVENGSDEKIVEQTAFALGMPSDEERSTKAAESAGRAAWFATAISLLSLLLSIIALWRT